LTAWTSSNFLLSCRMWTGAMRCAPRSPAYLC